MAGKSKAYIKEIKANGPDGVHSVSPAWVVTFIRWKYRYLNVEDPQTDEGRKYFLATRRPLVVENDCASVVVSYSKDSHTPSMQAMFYPGDINYLTAVAPGDFVFVNMLEWEEDARKVADKARELKPINGEHDGFKGMFKVQSVRRVLSIDPATGTKKVMFQVSAHGFTEFNNTLYFNPFLLSGNEADNQFLFVSRISNIWEQYVGKKGTYRVQDILKLLIDSSIGAGFNVSKKENLQVSQNTHFFIPDAVGHLLGIPGATAAKDIYIYLFGVQNYVVKDTKKASLAQGMNPEIGRKLGRYLYTKNPCQGASLIKPEYWNQVAVWSILNQYTNSPINELFTTLRIDPDGKVMPTLVFRQMPYSTEKYKGLSTKFLNLPRWKVDPNLLLDINIGREEAARFNFVQVFATVPQASDSTNQGLVSQQIASKNYVIDQLDVRRSGLKPYIITSNYDEIVTDKKASNAAKWAKLLADSLIGGHLKLNGSIQCFGIVDPIAVGDNLELDSVVYHIEKIDHSCSVQPDGRKSFTTSIEIAHGLDLRSETEPYKVFGQMDFQDMQNEQKSDYEERDGNLPGFSDEQDIVGRENGRQGKNTTKEGRFPSNPGKLPKKLQKKGKNK